MGTQLILSPPELILSPADIRYLIDHSPHPHQTPQQWIDQAQAAQEGRHGG